MIPHVLLSLMLASPPVEVNAEMVKTYDLEKMTWAEAKRLEGKPVRVSFAVLFINGMPAVTISGARGFHVLTDNIAMGRSLVMIQPGLNVGPINQGTRVVADGIISTHVSPARTIDGTRFPEKRLVAVRDAHPVRP